MKISIKDVELTNQKVKNVIKNVTANVSGASAEKLEKIGEEHIKITDDLKALKARQDVLTGELKDAVKPLFDLTDDAYTRYIETSKLIFTLSIKHEKTYAEFDQDAFIDDLYELMPDLYDVFEKLREKHTEVLTTNPVEALRVRSKSKKVQKAEKPLKESEDKNWLETVKQMVQNIYNYVTRKLDRFDLKYDRILLKYDL